MASLTPMMQQYLKIHEQAKDALLFFRAGDFYEMFFDDAVTASRELDLVLTGRDCGLDEKAPMCGVPYHAVDTYIARLVEKGYKVAICEQMSNPKESKGLVEREIVRIVSSGTVIDSKGLSEHANNYLACIYYNKTEFAVAYVDVSTGEMYAKFIDGDNIENDFLNFIATIKPSEILCNSVLFSDASLKEKFISVSARPLAPLSAKYFSLEAASAEIIRQLGVYSLNATGIESKEALIKACGALFIYLRETQKNDLSHINKINLLAGEDFMQLDYSTKRNLELTETMRASSKKGSLLWVLDKTASAVGARTLARWITQPLLSEERIAERHDAVGELKSDIMLIEDLQAIIAKTSDIQRLSSKISYGTVNGRELLALKETIYLIPKIKLLIKNAVSLFLKRFVSDTDALADIAELIEDAIDDECGVQIKDGNLIKNGYDAKIDELKTLKNNAKDILLSIEAKERESSGIKNLKIKYNKVFGYYFEVTKGNLSSVPEYFIRKQTLVNAERFYTEELKEIEIKLLSAHDELISRESEVYSEIIDQLLLQLPRIQQTSSRIGALDAITSLAFVSYKNNYVRPYMNNEGKIEIQNGRHPVIEQIISLKNFIPNDAYINEDADRMLIITGPNMAGKSTYIRQIALISLMNQIGSFVPSDEANLCIVDRIFTRVGASDDIASGQSTFMVEMSEVANILKNATRNSLVILDEVGRGTSTFDGLSIAWAVLEFLSNRELIGAKSLFATHYHELTDLEGRLEGVVNYSIKLIQAATGVVFTHKIVRGAADKSYGIEVAKLAGLPALALERAEEILNELEVNEAKKNAKKPVKRALSNPHGDTMSLLNYKSSHILEELKNMPLYELTPIEVVNYVAKLQKELE